MYCSAEMMSVHDDDINILSEKDNRVSPTEQALEDLTLGPSTKGKGSFGRMSVPVKTASAVQEHEEVICPGRCHGPRSDFSCRNNSTLTVST